MSWLRYWKNHLYEFLIQYSLTHLAQPGFRRPHSCKTTLSKMVSQWVIWPYCFFWTSERHLTWCTMSCDCINWSYTMYVTMLYNGLHVICIRQKTSCTNTPGNVRASYGYIRCTPALHSRTLLFIIYMNDMAPEAGQRYLDVYVVDSMLGTAGENVDLVEHKLGSHIGNIVNWYDDNKMTINYDNNIPHYL